MEQINMPAGDAALSLARALRPNRLPGFANGHLERALTVSFPPWFIDRCRRAYLSISYPVDGPRLVGVTSALYGEGKTSVAVAMAIAMAADTREPTLLLECDMEHASMAHVMGFSGSPGLGEWLQGDSELRVIRAAPIDNLCIIPAGDPPQDPARLVYQLSQSDLMDQLVPQFRNIVIDLPPVVNIAYSSLASSLAQRIVVVARHGVTPIDDLEKAIFLLGSDRVSGIILNGQTSRVPGWLRRLL